MTPKKSIRSLYIAGNRWGLHELTPALNKKFLKLLNEKRPNIALRGFCDAENRQLYIRPGQRKADEQNTFLHEGFHALLYEIGCVHGLSHIQGDEKTISALTDSLLSYMKQTDLMPA